MSLSSGYGVQPFASLPTKKPGEIVGNTGTLSEAEVLADLTAQAKLKAQSSGRTEAQELASLKASMQRYRSLT